MERRIDPVAEKGFQDAHTYDMRRPSYPAQAVEKLMSMLPSKIPNRSPRIVDLAAGTGKFTELLAAQGPGKLEIKAVEPHRQMRQVLEKKNLIGVDVMHGMAEEMEAISGEWADAVVVAQAFHWFASTDTLREIYRVLAPGGVLFLLWNENDDDVTAWQAELKNFASSFANEKQRARHDLWREVFNDRPADNSFKPQTLFDLPLRAETISWTMWETKQAFWDRFSTLSFVSAMDAGQREDVHRKVLEIIENGHVEISPNGEMAVHGHVAAIMFLDLARKRAREVNMPEPLTYHPPTPLFPLVRAPVLKRTTPLLPDQDADPKTKQTRRVRFSSILEVVEGEGRVLRGRKKEIRKLQKEQRKEKKKRGKGRGRGLCCWAAGEEDDEE
ncbi:MAG: hypothetical protein Q9227_000085 [Pyrenula ochraceoflavens]